MSVSRVNDNLPVTTKISTLSEQILEIFGLVQQAKFSENDVSQLTTDFGLDRKYLRNQSLGHTLSTYTGWTHLHSESGYSLWKYSPTNYKYNSVNELYLDDVVLENRGEANSESDTTFTYVYLDAGSLFINNTTEAGTEDGTSFSLMNDTSDYLYMGLSSTFAGISFEFDTRGSNYTLECEYYNGSVWTSLDISGATYTDDTSNFESDGRIYWTIPSNWAITTINSASAYWVRISTSTTPVTTATSYIITPANSVISLLKMSSEEILNEDWAWCSYGSSIYVTIRNAGQSAYEGNYYITSSSTSVNKQNYFIHNHEFLADYEDSTYVQTDLITNLDDLSDVVVNSGLIDWQFLVWDAGDAVWTNKTLNLDDLNNVAVDSGLTNGEVLTWDSGDQVWRNATISETMTHSGLSDMPDIGGTNSDHDARYYTEAEITSLLAGKQNLDSGLTSLAGLTYTATAFVKYTGADTFTLDTNAYSLTSHTHSITNLTDVQISGQTTNQVLAWNGSNWVNSNLAIEITSLDNLSDVRVDSGLAYGQGLVWDSGDSIWRNQEVLLLDQSTVQTVIGTPIFSDIKISGMSLGTSTYSTIKDFANSFGSAGRKTGGVISDAGSGYVAVTTGTGFIKATDDDNTNILFFDWPSPSNIQIPSFSTRYIGVEYNLGTPQVVVRSSFNWNLDSEFPLGRVINENINGSDKLYVYNSPWWVTDGMTNTIEVIRSFGLLRRDESLGGLTLSVTGTRNISVTAGTVWSALNEFNFSGIDTSVSGTVEAYWYKSGTGWQSSDVSQYSVTQWNDVSQTTLQTIDANKYCNVWVYVELDANTPKVAIIYPQAQYNTPASAEATSAPSNLPTHISNVGILLGRIIIKQSVDAPVATQTAFTTTFSASVVTDHGNLSGLADDDHTQYLLVDGTRALSGNISVGGYAISNVKLGSLTSNGFVKTSGEDGTLSVDTNTYSISAHTHTLDNLSDVMVSSGLIDGQILTWDSGDSMWRNITPVAGVTNHALLSNLDYASSGHTGFQPTGSYLTDLSGLDTDDLSQGATNKYDQTVVLTEGSNITITGTYPNFTINATSGVTTLDSLSDVMVSSGLTNGQVLTWDSGDSIWRNMTSPAGVTSHPLLTELDYASSGHTGFQSSLVNSAGLSTAIGGDVAVVDGGTGKSSWTQYLIPYADTTTSFSQIAIGTSGQVLTSNGVGSAPTFQDSTGGASSLDELTDVSVASGLVTGQVLTWDSADATWRNILPIYSKSFVITYPTASADSPIWRVPESITITHIHVLCIGGTSIEGRLWQYDSNGLNGSSIDTSSIIGLAGQNVDDDGTIDDSGSSGGLIVAGNYLGWKTTTVTGSVTRVIVTFDYTMKIL